MMGVGRAWGAVTILNATATGLGCALATQDTTQAAWTPRRDSRIAGSDDRLVQAVAAACVDFASGGADVTVQCPWPPSRGLKTSSSVAAAVVRAAAASNQVRLSDLDVERRAVAACRAAGVTLTGAYDDQVAVVRGGAHVTDNSRHTIVASIPVEPWAVAIWVPEASIAKSALRALDASVLRDEVRAAQELVLAGDLPAAMTRNGAAFHALYEAAGLPVSDAPTKAALKAGALGAGLSGTGPAVAALFDRPLELPAIAGGTWRWTKVAP